jgi:hypothetical protein
MTQHVHHSATPTGGNRAMKVLADANERWGPQCA